ncbi:MAG: hypothetical protein J0H19_21840, partial [Rhodospirillales bacterium]|nr:hypothetical protein [Rhodospirillales bacterium]
MERAHSDRALSDRLTRDGDAARGADGARAAEAKLAEAAGLAASINLVIVHSAILPLRTRRPATLLGEGQVAQQGQALRDAQVTVAVVDAALSPVQQRQ